MRDELLQAAKQSWDDVVQLGETRGFFSDVVEAGFHQEAIRMVARGEVDGSAIDSQVLEVELANRESQSSWREFLLQLKQRGLRGVEFVVTDDHELCGCRATTRAEIDLVVGAHQYLG